MPGEPEIAKALIEDRHFGLVVDLGCGDGALGKLIRGNVDYLIGVDHNAFILQKAVQKNVYDELINIDIRDYVPPPETQAVFMLELIEHIPKDDGVALLSKLSWVPIIVLTTPQKFATLSFKNGHVSLWTEEDFRVLGYETIFFTRTPLAEFLYGKAMLAFKGL